MTGGGEVDNIKDEMSMFFENKKKSKKESKKSNKGFFSFLFSKKNKTEEDEEEEEKGIIKTIDDFNEVTNKGNIDYLYKETNNKTIKEKDKKIIELDLEDITLDKNKLIIEQEKDIIFEENEDELDKKYLKIDKLNVNLIHFDLNMTNKENYIYFNNFKVDVVGGFYAIDDLDILDNYLKKINDKDIPFIVISSGTSGKKVISICKKYDFVKEIIIFCRNYNYNEHYITEYPEYVKKVFTNIKKVYEYIKTFEEGKYKDGIERLLNENKYIFSSDLIKMDKQLQTCPLITSYEYDKCYFLEWIIYVK